MLFSLHRQRVKALRARENPSLHQQLIVSLKIPFKSSFNAQVSLLTAHARSIEATLAILLLQSSFFSLKSLVVSKITILVSCVKLVKKS